MIIREQSSKNFIREEDLKISDVTCDICGHSCKKFIGNGNTAFEYMTLTAKWGFGSRKNGQAWTAQVCEKCSETELSNIIDFKIIA